MPMTTKDLDVLKDQMSAVVLAYKRAPEYQGPLLRSFPVPACSGTGPASSAAL